VKADVPVRIDGNGTVIFGEGVHLGYHEAPRMGSGEILVQARRRTAKIVIGSGTATSNNVSIIAMESIEIGTDCRIGDMTSIIDCDFHEVSPLTRDEGSGAVAPVRLGDHVWIGSRVIILKGVTIGNNSVIGAGSVVTRSIPADSLAAGVPARVIRDL
jgi:acetyltransferase-like isoleucine patch superfamily enzyme